MGRERGARDGVLRVAALAARTAPAAAAASLKSSVEREPKKKLNNSSLFLPIAGSPANALSMGAEMRAPARRQRRGGAWPSPAVVVLLFALAAASGESVLIRLH